MPNCRTHLHVQKVGTGSFNCVVPTCGAKNVWPSVKDVAHVRHETVYTEAVNSQGVRVVTVTVVPGAD